MKAAPPKGQISRQFCRVGKRLKLSFLRERQLPDARGKGRGQVTHSKVLHSSDCPEEREPFPQPHCIHPAGRGSQNAPTPSNQPQPEKMQRRRSSTEIFALLLNFSVQSRHSFSIRQNEWGFRQRWWVYGTFLGVTTTSPHAAGSKAIKAQSINQTARRAGGCFSLSVTWGIREDLYLYFSRTATRLAQSSALHSWARDSSQSLTGEF